MKATHIIVFAELSGISSEEFLPELSGSQAAALFALDSVKGGIVLFICTDLHLL